MYQITEYAERIASEDNDIREKYEIVKSLSKDFTVENDIALKLDKEIVEHFKKDDEKNIEINIPEIELRYVQGSTRKFPDKISSSFIAAKIFRELMGVDQILLYEQFVILFLDRSNKIVGFYKHSKGGVSGTVVDVRLILLAAIKCLASGLVLCHNHPSGGLVPSEQDKTITRKLRMALESIDMNILDHIIVTSESYYSFSDEGLLGLDGIGLEGSPTADDNDKFDSVDENKLKSLVKRAKKLKF
jgi:DNA repair protein RadC